MMMFVLGLFTLNLLDRLFCLYHHSCRCHHLFKLWTDQAQTVLRTIVVEAVGR